jgi:prolyl-tRNA synthetase
MTYSTSNVQKDGHENVRMPLFIPESLLQKEKDH